MSILKYIFKDDLKDRLAGIFALLKDLSEKQTGLEYIEAILRYIANASPDGNITYEDLKTAIEQTIPDKGDNILPTIADALKEQGKQEGIQQGIQQGILQKSREDVIEILEMRFGIIPRSILSVLNEISDPLTLKSLLKKAVTLKSLDEFEEFLDIIMK
ncbi:MAG: hypothetical protein JRI32_01865 [Deltaproteobacteria bacterium]|nr:hypothetical protein [Deltaproteobacteria bacterium]